MTTQIEGAVIGLPWQSLAHVLGWTLLHFLWQGALVAFVLWVVLGILGGRSSWSRYSAACFALVLMAAMPLITFVVLTSAEYKALREGRQSVADVHITVQVGSDGPVTPWPTRLEATVDRCVPWLLVAWFVGAMYFMARLNVGLLAARRLKSLGTQEPPEELQRLFEALRVRLGVARAVRLLHSALVQVPTVIGWLRPVVLIPASCLTGLSAEQIEAIFCHELAHVRRHDYLISVLQYIAEALLFYHPAVWWVSKQVRRERECCCDEVAVAMGSNVLAYARALSYLEEQRAETPELVLGANGGVLSMRIQRLLGSKREMEGSPLVAMVILTAMCLGASLYFAAVSRAQSSAMHAAQAQPVDGDASTMALKGVYKAWLEQDASYLITPEERTAFLNLTNDEERDKFIEQFWARRDPPGAPAGTFRQEVYVRFAYANQHFAADIPGWRTDRGRIYIVNGAPYEIDSHPSGGEDHGSATSFPFEIWHYKAAKDGEKDVYLKFVDGSNTGLYRLVGQVAPPPSAGDQAAQAPGGAQEYEGSPLRKIGGGVSAPVAVYEVEPEYSAQAKAAKFNGVVLVNLIVNQNGMPENVHVLRGVGMGLDEKAVQTVQQYRFKPAMEDGKPVPVSLNIEVNFRIF